MKKTTKAARSQAKSRSTRTRAKTARAAKAPAKRAKAPAKRAKAPAKRAKAPAKRAKPARRGSPARTSTRQRARARSSRWVAFVAKHGVVLASARGSVPAVAEAVAGEPIIGSWWAHAKGKAIFAALSEIDDSTDVRCFKLVDGKVTFVHRKTWPALVRLGREGVLAPEQLATVRQEHLPTGEHRNIITAFPDWVDEETSAAADRLSTADARAQLAWLDS